MEVRRVVLGQEVAADAGDALLATHPACMIDSALSTALADRYRIEREIGAGGMATVYVRMVSSCFSRAS